jgi:DNA-binding transcriptional MocR family regulator
MVAALENAIRVSTWQTPSLNIALACRWIESGEVDALEEAKRRDAKQRQKIARRLLRGLDLVTHPVSYFVWLQLPEGLRAEKVAAELVARNMVTTAEPFATTVAVPHALRLAIGSIPEPALESALAVVAGLIAA